MKKLFSLLLLLFVFATFASPALAQTSLAGNACLYQGVVTMDCVPIIFANIIYWLLILSGTVAVFFVIFGGIKFLTSSGDQKKVEDAKKTIVWAVIGLVVVLLSFAIVRILAQVTGVDANCLTRFGFGICI